jgi:hypothetical protein
LSRKEYGVITIALHPKKVNEKNIFSTPQMSWNTLNEDLQWEILTHARRPTVAATVCLRDMYCYRGHEHIYCVGFLQVKGTWLHNGNFACNVDEEFIPEWDEDSSPMIQSWMEFTLRKKDNGVLVLPDGEDDGEWIEVGRLQNVYVPVYTWHGVMKQTSEKTRYNCVWFDGVSVNEGSDENDSPGYSIQVVQNNAHITHDECGSDDPFDAFFITNG